MRRVLVCGGRDYADRPEMFYTLDEAHALEPIACLIHGGAPGADRLAKEWAILNGIPQEEYKAKWAVYGNYAGPARNHEMLLFGKPDIVFAFPGGKGTKDMIRQARKAKVQVVEYA
jgi:hypothetical protein